MPVPRGAPLSRQRVASRCVAATILASQKIQHSAQLVPEGHVLNDLSEEVCLANAEACGRKAADVTDLKIKQAFLDIERSWLILAQSFPIGEQQVIIHAAIVASAPMSKR
jgi:hypothetical protein